MKRKDKNVVEVQTKDLPFDLLGSEGTELDELDDNFEYEQKMSRVRRAHEKFFDDE